MKTIKIVLVLINVMIIQNSNCQSLINKDSLTINEVDDTISKLYGTYDTTYYLLTNSNFYHLKTYGSEIRVEMTKNRILRISIQSVLNFGFIATEYWYNNNNLIFIYKTHCYFEEYSKDVLTKNFKGQHYWEIRYYFKDNKIATYLVEGKVNDHKWFLDKTIELESKKILNYINTKMF